jgi:4a-hydroxytetrahydrobiopterin dehydratase
VRAIWGRKDGQNYLTDALALLPGWIDDGATIKRVLRLDDSQHAALTERIQVVADALEQRPHVRRLDGHTQISLATPVTNGAVALAARIEDAYRLIMGPTPPEPPPLRPA